MFSFNNFCELSHLFVTTKTTFTKLIVKRTLNGISAFYLIGWNTGSPKKKVLYRKITKLLKIHLLLIYYLLTFFSVWFRSSIRMALDGSQKTELVATNWKFFLSLNHPPHRINQWSGVCREPKTRALPLKGR